MPGETLPLLRLFELKRRPDKSEVSDINANGRFRIWLFDIRTVKLECEDMKRIELPRVHYHQYFVDLSVSLAQTSS